MRRDEKEYEKGNFPHRLQLKVFNPSFLPHSLGKMHFRNLQCTFFQAFKNESLRTAAATHFLFQILQQETRLKRRNLKPQKEAKKLFNLFDSVHICFISASGRVSTFSEPSKLRIFKFSQQYDDCNQTFIQVGGWTHPSVPGVPPDFWSRQWSLYVS